MLKYQKKIKNIRANIKQNIKINIISNINLKNTIKLY